jgi:hypothetical protein
LKEDQKVVKEEKEDQDAVINSDNNSELFEILSFEIDRMYIDFINNNKGSNGEGSDGKGSGDEVLRTRLGRAFGI